jgi:membrane protein implicated in regulation of membrane protease activity
MQILLLVSVGLAGYLLFRKFVADAEKLAARSRDQQRERETGAQGTLVKDPVTGEYHLKRD